MDVIGVLTLLFVLAAGVAAVLLLRRPFLRRLAGVVLGLASLATFVTTVQPLWHNPERGPGGLLTVFIVWVAVAFGGLGLACGLWFGAALFGRRPTLASWAATIAVGALVTGIIMPPLLYLQVEIRTAAHSADLSASIGSASAELFARSHPALLKVFHYTAGRAEALVGYAQGSDTGPFYYLYLTRDGARWRVTRVESVDNRTDAVVQCFTIPPYR
ncbi:MAG: hypothetical protein ACM3XN_04795 [Chloroflexota bacterium]